MDNFNEKEIMERKEDVEYLKSLDWLNISANQKLSETFIREMKDYVNWHWISAYQKLSEPFIREMKYDVDWLEISVYQKLSESFIREMKDDVNWYWISGVQKLSETFIREMKDYVDWNYISRCQKLSSEFREEFYVQISENNWLYWSKEDKMKAIKDCGLYEIDGDYIIAYKSTKNDGHSVFNWQYKYEVGQTYESHCDCNVDIHNSFGLSAWTKDGALEYYNTGDLYKVRVHIDDIGALVQNGNKLRCFKIEILEKANICL